MMQEITGFEFEPSLKIQVHARYRPTYLTAIFYSCIIMTLGLMYRLCKWFPSLEKYLFTQACKDFQHATHIFVQSSLGSTEMIKLKKIEDFVMFDYYGSRFLLQGSKFVPLHSLPRTSVPHASLLFGPNRITFTHRSYFTIIYENIFSPYNLFQCACMVLWALQGSWIYVYVIAGVTLISTFFILKEAIGAQHGLREATKIRDEFVVMHEGGVKKRTVDLLPGDLICLSSGPVPADVILRRGTVLVDESMLTGESAAVAKAAVSATHDDSSHYSPQAQHTVYAGTSIKSCTEATIAMVWATGNMTSHSKMLQAIVYPRQHSLPFYEDVRKVTMSVLLLSSLVSALTLVSFIFGLCPWRIVVRSTDLFAIIFELYSIITVGTVFAQGRLRLRGVICRVAASLIPASSINTICFDKTGTLTEDSMKLVNTQDTISDDQKMVMAACHSLYFIDGNPTGDVMDLEAFKASGANMKLDASIILNENVMTVEKSFFFCPKLRRQTVLLKDGTVLTKGAPESISEILTDIPNDYDSQFREYTRKGLRVIACAIRRDAKKSEQRAELERDMKFVGYLAYENVVKVEAQSCIQLLQKSHIDCLMVTGDSPLTAIAVARQVNILSASLPVYWSKKIGGSSFVWQNADNDETLPIEHVPDQIVLTGDFPTMHRYRSNVYARMSATQKSELVTSLRLNHNRIIAFCGDGANDCAAMCASDAGIAMSAGSDSAALAASFLINKLDSVPEVIRQARVSLVTTLALVKLFVLSTAIQLLAMSFSFPKATLSNGQVIYMDAICMTSLDLLIAKMSARKKISKIAPHSRLLNTSHAFYYSIHILLILLNFVSLYTFVNVDLSAKSNIVFFTATFMILTVGCLSARPDRYRTSFSTLFAASLFALLFYTCNLMYGWFPLLPSFVEYLEIPGIDDTQRRFILYHSIIYSCVAFGVDIALIRFMQIRQKKAAKVHSIKDIF